MAWNPQYSQATQATSPAGVFRAAPKRNKWAWRFGVAAVALFAGLLALESCHKSEPKHPFKSAAHEVAHVKKKSPVDPAQSDQDKAYQGGGAVQPASTVPAAPAQECAVLADGRQRCGTAQQLAYTEFMLEHPPAPPPPIPVYVPVPAAQPYGGGYSSGGGRFSIFEWRPFEHRHAEHGPMRSWVHTRGVPHRYPGP